MHEERRIPRLFSIAEASGYLRLGPARVRALIHSGDLRATRPGGGGKWFIREDELVAFLERRTDGTAR